MKVEAMVFRFSKPSSSAPSSPSAETRHRLRLRGHRGVPRAARFLPPARPSAVLPTRRAGQRVAEAGDGGEGPCGACRPCLGHPRPSGPGRDTALQTGLGTGPSSPRRLRGWDSQHHGLET